MLFHIAEKGLILSFPLAECAEGDIRLANGRTPHEGRVEICRSNVWEQLCTLGWDVNDAKVACRELGYTSIGKD